ncbi:hypothetical protein ACFV0H_09990 [Streptomyces erythrochromogenes]|uniref:Lipase n=1 Tax=Streptomyces erythrochromogenes TaxID=285574 RepID=A0ABZ1QJE7_9ACTN|nr:hypothetical protein [Streptomyces erythrochromogenes]MCX5588356.1 hypothetical protein [Streptomyces erythrochromogenes]
MTVRRGGGSSSSYRLRRSSPTGPANATVVLSGPGTVSAYDGVGRDDLLLASLTRHLVSGGAQVLQCDMPARHTGVPSEEVDEVARAERLEHLLRAYAHPASGPVSLLGFSLGGHAVLRLLGSTRSRLVDRAVLVGTVVGQKTFVNAPITSLDFVYGSCDLIGYQAVDAPADELPPLTYGPDVYGKWCASRLSCRTEPTVRIHVLNGLGHTLHPCVAEPVMDPVPFLAALTSA